MKTMVTEKQAANLVKLQYSSFLDESPSNKPLFFEVFSHDTPEGMVPMAGHCHIAWLVWLVWNPEK